MEAYLRFRSLSITDLKHQYRPVTIPVQHRAVHAAAISVCIDTFLDRVLYLASGDDEFCARDSAHERAKVARTTAQVCRRWRTRALNIPSIWLGPVLSWYSHPSWLEIVLERSKPLPFPAFIPYDALERYPADTLTAILKHLPRIQHLDMTLGLPCWLKVKESAYLQQEAPCLQAFSLSIAVGSDQRKKILIPGQENLFGGWAPVLSQFHLQYCPMNLTPKMYSDLRGLHLDMLHFISPVQLLNALRNMTNLESLQLARAPGNPHLMVDTPELPEIHLMNLKELQISESTSVSAGIFKHLRLPSSCSIRLGCYHALDGQHLREIRKRLKESLSTWECEPLTGRLTLRVGATYMTWAIEALDTDESLTVDHPHVSLALSWKPCPTQFSPLLSLFQLAASIFQHCAVPPDSLVVYAEAKLPTQLRNHFSKWLRKMDEIQSIELHSNAAFSLLKLHLDISEDNENTDTDSTNNAYDGYEEDVVLLPFLTDLILVDVNFPSERRRYWKRLMSTLKLRQDAGYSLMLVDFVNCLGDFDLREVGKYVTEVKRDGEDYNESDESDEDSANDSDYTIQADSDVE